MMIRKASANRLFYPKDPDRFQRAVAPRSAHFSANTTLPTALLLPHASWKYILEPLHKGLGSIAHLRPKQILLLAPLHGSTTPPPTLTLPASEGVVVADTLYRFITELRDLLAANFGIPCDDEPFLEESSWELLLPLIASYIPEAKILPILSGTLNAKTVRSYSHLISEAITHEPETLCIVTANANPPLPSPRAEEEAATTLSFLTEDTGLAKSSCNSGSLRALKQQPWYDEKRWNILDMSVEGESYATLNLEERNAHVWQITAVLE